MLTQPRTDHWETVAGLYDGSWDDFIGLWANEDNLALHWGYWDERTRTHADSLLNMNREMAHLAGLKSGERVLDAGCGFGGSSFWLAKELGAEVVGINISEGQLSRARAIAVSRGLAERVRFERADMLQTPFADDSFDVVWAQEAIDHAPDQRLFLREAMRLLRPGGRLIIEDRFRAERALSSHESNLLREFCSRSLMPMMPSGPELVAWTREAGFEASRMVDITSACARSCRRFRAQTSITYPLALVLRRFGLRTDAQINFLRGLRCEQKLQQSGALLLAMIVAVKPGKSSLEAE